MQRAQGEVEHADGRRALVALQQRFLLIAVAS